jgi:DNA-binding transcriptional LysR family regulator
MSNHSHEWSVIQKINMKRTDLSLLVALDALLTERSVTDAAERLQLSQPATSALLARLRKQLNDPLLIRTPRGMTPTARALRLAAPLKHLLGEIEHLLTSEQEFEPLKVETTMAVAAADYAETVIFPALITRLRTEAPGLRLAIYPIDVAVISQQLEKGEVDSAFLQLSTAPQHLRVQRLFEEHYVCVARRGHPTITRRLSLEEFCQLDHILVSPSGGGFAGATDLALARVKRRRAVAVSVPHFLAAVEFVKNSDLIAVVPRRLATLHQDALQLLTPPILIDGFTLVLAWHERLHRDPLHQWFRRVVREVARSLAPSFLQGKEDRA